MADTNAAVVARRYIETLGAGQFDDCIGLFHEKAVIKFPESVVPQRTLSKAQFGGMLRNMPNIFRSTPTYTLIDQVSQGDRSCIEFSGVGQMNSGAPFKNEYCIVFLVRDGRIVEMREYLDTGALKLAPAAKSA